MSRRSTSHLPKTQHDPWGWPNGTPDPTIAGDGLAQLTAYSLRILGKPALRTWMKLERMRGYDSNFKVVTITQHELAKRAKQSLRTTKRALSRLRACGAITTHVQCAPLHDTQQWNRHTVFVILGAYDVRNGVTRVLLPEENFVTWARQNVPQGRQKRTYADKRRSTYVIKVARCSGADDDQINDLPAKPGTLVEGHLHRESKDPNDMGRKGGTALYRSISKEQVTVSRSFLLTEKRHAAADGSVASFSSLCRLESNDTQLQSNSVQQDDTQHAQSDAQQDVTLPTPPEPGAPIDEVIAYLDAVNEAHRKANPTRQHPEPLDPSKLPTVMPDRPRRVIKTPHSLPPETPDTDRVRILVRAYRDAVRDSYGFDPNLYGSMEDVRVLTRSRHYPRLCKGAAATIEYQVPPGAWARWIVQRAHDKGDKDPPNMFMVWAPGLIKKWHGWFKRTSDELYADEMEITRTHYEQHYRCREAVARARGREGVRALYYLPVWYADMREQEIAEGFDDPMLLWPTVVNGGTK